MKPFDENRFDDVFRSKLGNFSETPPPEVLGRIRQTMSQPPASGASWFGKYWMFVAVTGVTGLVVLSLSLTSADNKAVHSDKPYTDLADATVNQDITIEEKQEKQEIQEKQSTVSLPAEKISYANNGIGSNVSENTDVKIITGTITPAGDEEKSNSTPVIKKLEEISVNIKVTSSTCKKSNGAIEITPTQSQRYNYYWADMTGTTSPKRTGLSANTYSVRITNEGGGERTFEILVKDTGTVTAQFTHNELSPAAGIPIYFSNNSRYSGQKWTQTSAVSFRWYFGDGQTSTLAEPEYIYNKEGNYIVSLVATSLLGCKDSVALIYLGIEGSDLQLPNVITPNNDGINDEFRPIIEGVVYYTCTIYNRNGEMVYEWQGTEGAWNGKIKNSDNYAAPGVYYYVITGQGSDGKQFVKKSFLHLQ
jgi:gliding motility-associated-like protein